MHVTGLVRASCARPCTSMLSIPPAQPDRAVRPRRSSTGRSRHRCPSAASATRRCCVPLEALTFRLDGSRAAANTIIRKRAVLHGALGYAAEAGLLPDNPLDTIAWQIPRSSAALDPAVVASPAQVSALLDAVTQTRPEMTAFFGCLYYAALRPEEAVALRFADCDLPGSGWGMLRLAAATPRTAAAWTGSGTSHEQRGLKHRPDGAIRMVPVPPVLAAMLRAHHAAYGTAPDGRLFRGTRGGPLSESVYGRAWHAARALALGPELAASGLARRPYDLRHAALSLWLNAGGDPAQIAARAGHSVAVLLTVYSHCIHGHDDLLNQQIGHVLEPSAGRGPCPSVEKPAVAPTARRARTPSAMRPWLARPARRRPVDHADIKRTHARTATLATVV
jgi:integrase